MAINAYVAESNKGRRIVYYYRRPDIAVTNHGIENAEGSYFVRDLDLIKRVRIDAYPARRAALILGAVELVLAVPLAVAYGPVALLCAAIAIAAGLGVAHVIDSRHNPRWMALSAVHFGEEITLFQSCDQQEFEQVRRAVIRAVEANRPRY
ncbi:DUF6232 family protein [Dactylosporangium sp. NPDC049525]|uniref:DUF6232 family protein n=1 Tax=Dactylosporangium sp. NPDC049525 TaxID=3154730 RepID=UPI003415A593